MINKAAFSILVFCLSFILSASFCTASQGPLAGKIIVIDPGHGGTENGAIANRVREADVNLAIGLKVRDRLAATGAIVVMTRISDQNVLAPHSPIAEELQARVDITKAADADIFISLHANSNPKPETAGAISFYQSGRPNDLARAIQSALIKQTGTIDKGVRPANFHVLRENQVPAALIETGFLTNQAEAEQLIDNIYQDKIADGICNGVINYFQSRSDSTSPAPQPPNRPFWKGPFLCQ